MTIKAKTKGKKAGSSVPPAKKSKVMVMQESDLLSSDENSDFSDSSDSSDSSEDQFDSGAEQEFDQSQEEDSEVSSDSYETVDASKKQKNNGSESFAKAMSAILDSKVKAHDRKNPILIRSKKTAKELESAKLEAKARRALNAEKKISLDKDRVTNLIPEENATHILEQERKLRKIAQRGVVQLFNAIQAAHNVGAEKSKQHILGLTKKDEQGRYTKSKI